MDKHIVVVEDDYLQREPIRDEFAAAFPKARIETITSESEFRGRLRELRRRRPDVIIMDVMLRWANPHPNSPQPPSEVAEGGYYRAGLRCAELVRDDPSLRNVPIVLYTILERDDVQRAGRGLGNKILHVRKGQDIEYLIRRVKALVPS
jgi:CheY-like chemotaxis protein